MLASASPAGADSKPSSDNGSSNCWAFLPVFPPNSSPSASQSHQHALVAALNQKTRGLARRAGLAGQPPFAVYTSELGHFFARKNAVAAGLASTIGAVKLRR